MRAIEVGEAVVSKQGEFFSVPTHPILDGEVPTHVLGTFVLSSIRLECPPVEDPMGDPCQPQFLVTIAQRACQHRVPEGCFR